MPKSSNRSLRPHTERESFDMHYLVDYPRLFRGATVFECQCQVLGKLAVRSQATISRLFTDLGKQAEQALRLTPAPRERWVQLRLF